MKIEAFPMQFVAVTDGVRAGRQHVVLFLEHAVVGEPRGFALSLADARRLLDALSGILPEAQQIQDRLRDSN